MKFGLGERVIHKRFGIGIIVGKFSFKSLTVFHLKLDVAPPVFYACGRNPIYVLPSSLKTALNSEDIENLKKNI